MKCNKKFVGTKSLHIFSKKILILDVKLYKKITLKVFDLTLLRVQICKKKIFVQAQNCWHFNDFGVVLVEFFCLCGKKVNFRQIMASLFTFINSGKNFTFYMTVVNIPICDVLTEKTINFEVFEKMGITHWAKMEKLCKN